MITAEESKGALVAIYKAIRLRRRDDFVFIGGGIVPLLITDPAAPPARPTKDVDVVFQVASMWDYNGLQDTLRQAGFVNHPSAGEPNCAMHFNGWRVDVLAMEPNAVSGDSNRWFPHVVKFAEPMELEGLKVLRASVPVFIASKLEAWLSRGKTHSGAPDYFHQDLEDVVAVIDGRLEIDREWVLAPRDVIEFVSSLFDDFLHSEGFLNALPGHLQSDERAALFIRCVENGLLSLL